MPMSPIAAAFSSSSWAFRAPRPTNSSFNHAPDQPIHERLTSTMSSWPRAAVSDQTQNPRGGGGLMSVTGGQETDSNGHVRAKSLDLRFRNTGIAGEQNMCVYIHRSKHAAIGANGRSAELLLWHAGRAPPLKLQDGVVSESFLFLFRNTPSGKVPLVSLGPVPWLGYVEAHKTFFRMRCLLLHAEWHRPL